MSEPRKSIACLPRAGDENPYQRLMMTGLAEGGHFAVSFGAAGKVMPLLRTQLGARPDVIHLDWIHGYLYRRHAWMTAVQHVLFFADVLLARLLGARLAWTLHNVRPHGRQDVGTARKWFARRCFFMRVFSAESVREVSELFAVTPERIRHVPEGSYASVYPAALPPQPSTDVRVIAYVGNLRPYKGVRELIEAFAATDAPDWRLRVYGRAFDESYAVACARAAAGDERIVIEEGFVAVERLPAIYAAADVVCLPFLKVDNSGSALMAMGYQKAVVAPFMGALCERLARQAELLYDPGELPAALRRAMSMSSAQLHAIGADNARALEQHTWRDYGHVLAEAEGLR